MKEEGEIPHIYGFWLFRMLSDAQCCSLLRDLPAKELVGADF